MTGNERGLLEVFLERQDEAIARLDLRLSALESKQIADQVSNTIRFAALEANLEKIAHRLEEFSGTMSRLDSAADFIEAIANNWKRIVGGFTVLLLLVEFVTRALVLWPLR